MDNLWIMCGSSVDNVWIIYGYMVDIPSGPMEMAINDG